MRNETYLRQDAPKDGARRMKPIALILALVLVISTAVGGTIAWLIADTEPVVNTFTYGDIDLNLDETVVDPNGDPVYSNGEPVKTTEGNDYKMVPGKEYRKDPAVTVLAGNEACWLFVKLEETGGATITNGDGSTTKYSFDDYLTYEVAVATEDAEGWTQLKDAEGKPVEGVYFRYVGEDTDKIAVTYSILKDDKISVLDTVDKDMLNALDNNGEDADSATYPSLSITAYAVQYSGFEAKASEGAEAPTETQTNAAALNAWQTVVAETSVETETPEES